MKQQRGQAGKDGCSQGEKTMQPETWTEKDLKKYSVGPLSKPCGTRAGGCSVTRNTDL